MVEVDHLDAITKKFNRSAVALIPYKYLALINTETNHLRVDICC